MRATKTRPAARAMFLKPTMVLKLVPLLVLIPLLQPASAFKIKRVKTDAGPVLKLRGDVRDGDYGRLKSALQDGSVVGLEITSGGGSLEDGVYIARVVRDKGLVIYASRECDSACAFIFWPRKKDTWTAAAKSECILFPTIARGKMQTAPALLSSCHGFWSDSECRILSSARSS